jgi:hypothetical protein
MDSRLKEMIGAELIKKNNGTLTKEQITLLNSCTPSDEVAKILGEEALLDMCLDNL